jgi:hypothetical protein
MALSGHSSCARVCPLLDEADIGEVDVKHEVTQGPLDYLFRRSALN